MVICDRDSQKVPKIPTRCYKVPCCTVAELVKYTISVSLLHLCMNVVTRISKLCDFLCQKLYTVDRVTKDDTLVDLQF